MEKWIVLPLCLLILTFLCWKEIRRNNKSRLNLRLIASILAVTSLYFIAQPISLERNLDPSKENTIVLLTEGFEKDSLAYLKNIPLFSTERSTVANNKNVTYIPDLEHFSNSRSDIKKVHILGNGLDLQELEIFENHQLIFHPSPITGFSSVNWNSMIRSGERLTIQGNFINDSKKPFKILLRGLSTTLDSIELSGSNAFELSTSPKLLNKAIYSLIAISEDDTIANEKIPIFIEAKKPFNILMLSSAPGFEDKFLKNWLYAEQYKLTIRTAISKDKFSTEFLNSERVTLTRVSPVLLQNFDILIADVSELSRLGSAESAAIQNQVEKGMGLVIRHDIAGGNGFYQRIFNSRQTKTIDQNNFTLNWPGRTAKKTSVPSVQAIEILPRSGEQALVKDNKNHVLASSKLFGAGRIIATTVSDTYTWMLSNNSADYSSYWSYILGKAARKTETSESSTILNKYPIVNAPVQIQLEGAGTNLPFVTIDKIPTYFAQNPNQSFRWNSNYWPIASGWQTIKSGKNETYWYVFDRNEWKSARAAQKIKKTAKFIDERKVVVQSEGRTNRTYIYNIPAIYFFILFIVACSYLWMERKLW